MRLHLSFWVVLAALSLSGASFAQSIPPGSPKPSTGAPGDKPGTNDPFGTQGEKAEDKKSPAEAKAERRQPTVDRIDVQGNAHTHTKEVLRHLVIKAGDELDQDKIFVSRVRLLQFGAFDEVSADVVRGKDPGHVTVVFKVHEKNTVYVTDVVYGSTVYTKHYGVLGLADSNFLGLGLGVSAQALVGDNAQHGFRLSLYEPDVQIAGMSFVAGLQGLQIQGRENACGAPTCYLAGPELRYTRAGGAASVGIRSSTYERFLFTYRYEAIQADRGEDTPGYLGPNIQSGRSHLSALVAGFDRDARDDAFLPTHGSRVQASITFSSRATSSDYEYSRYLVEAEKWIPLPKGLALRGDVLGGAVQGDAPFFEKFFAADYSYFSLGTAVSRLLEMNLSPDARYDAFLGLVGLEVDVPVWEKKNFIISRGYVAFGGRFTWSEATPGAGRTPVSATPFSGDISLRVESKFGTFNLSVAYLLDLLT